MEAIFLTLLEVSAASAVVILIVVLLSSIINRSYTARWKYWLWMVLAARLLIPFNPSFEAAPARVEVSIPAASISLPAAATAPAQPTQPVSPPPATGQLVLPDAPDLPITPAASAAPAITVMELLMLVWLAGVVLFLLWQAASYLRFRGQVRRWGLPVRRDSIIAYVRRQTEAEFGIGKSIPTLICKKVSSPMMIGFFRPLLILPHDRYNAADLSFILRHELTHCKRRDIWYKSLLLLANAVHWFNPAVWLMVREASRDLEISCDAAVMKNAGMEERRQYSETILACVHRELAMKTALSTHFYGGKKALKERFANILSTRKRRTGLLTFAAVLLCGGLVGGLVVCSAAVPDTDGPEDDSPSDIGQPTEGPKTPVERIIDSYYLDDHPEVQYNDMIPSELVLGRLVPQYTTDSGNQEKLGELLERLQNGERLSNNLELWNNQCDAMVYDDEGNIRGRVGISTVNYRIVAGSLEGESTSRCDFRWPELLETAIDQGLIDPDTAQVKYCFFSSFAYGILLYDDSREYFIATDREALHRVDFDVETFYPIPELTEMLRDNLDELFDYPPMQTGAASDPWTHANTENSSQVEPLYFSLGRQGEPQALRAGDTIGDWELGMYSARWEEEISDIPWVNGAHFTASWVNTPVEVNCTVSLTPYNTDQRLYWFQVSEEDEDKLPVLSGSSGAVWFQVSDDPVMAPLRDLAPGEQRSCRVALHSYVYYAMPMEAPNFASVSWLVTETGGQETRTAAFNAALVNFEGNSVGSYFEFAVQMPASWTVSNGGIYDDEGLLTAETLPWIWTSGIDDDTAFARLYERYPDAEPMDVTIGDLAGKRYYLTTTETDGPFAGAINNEIYYYLKSYNYLIGIKFYPKRGIGGIGTQREAFESSIRVIF